MKNGKWKSMMQLVVMGLFLMAFAPSDIYAQRDDRHNTNEKEKVTTNTRAKQSNKQVATHVKYDVRQPQRGTQVTRLPERTTVVNYRNTNYHYRDGVFYRPSQGSYIVATPPIGVHINILPPKPFRVRVAERFYYYHYGTYYLPLARGGYEIVSPPLGAIVDFLPAGYEVFELDGIVYYRYDETYYRAILEPNGNVAYEVVRV